MSDAQLPEDEMIPHLHRLIASFGSIQTEAATIRCRVWLAGRGEYLDSLLAPPPASRAPDEEASLCLWLAETAKAVIGLSDPGRYAIERALEGLDSISRHRRQSILAGFGLITLDSYASNATGEGSALTALKGVLVKQFPGVAELHLIAAGLCMIGMLACVRRQASLSLCPSWVALVDNIVLKPGFEGGVDRVLEAALFPPQNP